MEQQEQRQTATTSKNLKSVDELGEPCYATLKTYPILGNPKKDPNWKVPRVSPIRGKAPITRRRKRDV